MFEKVFKLMSAIGNHPYLYVSWDESILPSKEKKLVFSILEKKTRFHECEYSTCITSSDDIILLKNVYDTLKTLYFHYFGKEWEEL